MGRGGSIPVDRARWPFAGAHHREREGGRFPAREREHVNHPVRVSGVGFEVGGWGVRVEELGFRCGVGVIAVA